MDKKLPGIFANKIDKNMTNNEKVYYSNSKNKDELEKIDDQSKHKNIKQDLNINQKINNIFNSNKYVYKADVLIKTKNETLTKKSIGQNATHLITMENELIPTSDIVDIDFQ